MMSKKEKNSFWNTKQGKILSYGIHEHSSGLALIGANLNLLEKDFLRKEKVFTQKEHERMMKICKDSMQKCRDAIDYIYSETKKLNGYE